MTWPSPPTTFAERSPEGKLSPSDRQLIERLKQTYPPEVLAELFSDSGLSNSRKLSNSQRSSHISRNRSSTRTSLSSNGWTHVASADRPFSHTATISSRSSYGDEEDGASLDHKAYGVKTLQAMAPEDPLPSAQELAGSLDFAELSSGIVLLDQEPEPDTASVTYLCTWCGDLFNDVDAWKQHEKAAHELRFFWPCPVSSCDQAFLTADEFDRHHRSSHSCMNRMPAASVVRALEPKQMWACGFENCLEAFDNWDDRCVHVAQHYESFARDSSASNQGRHWSYSTMIRNLLRQPLTEEPFVKLLSLAYGPNEQSWPRLKWRPGNTGELRRRLEYRDHGSGIQSIVQLAHETGRPGNVATFNAMSVRKMMPPSPSSGPVAERQRQKSEPNVPTITFLPSAAQPPTTPKKHGLTINLPGNPFTQSSILTPPYDTTAPTLVPKHHYSRSDSVALTLLTANAPQFNNELRPPPSPFHPLSPLSPTGFEFSTLIEKFPTPPIPELSSRFSSDREYEECTRRPQTAGNLRTSNPDLSHIPPFPSHLFGTGNGFKPLTIAQRITETEQISSPASGEQSKPRPSTPVSPKALMNRAKTFITRERSASTTSQISPKSRTTYSAPTVNLTNTSPSSKAKKPANRPRPPVLRLAPRCDPPSEARLIAVRPAPPAPVSNSSRTPPLSGPMASSNFIPLARPNLVSTSSAPSTRTLKLSLSSSNIPAQAAGETPMPTSPPRARHRPIFAMDPFGVCQMADTSSLSAQAEPTSPHRSRHQPITIPYVPSRQSSLKSQARDEPRMIGRIDKARSARLNSDVVESATPKSIFITRKGSTPSMTFSPPTLTLEPLETIAGSPMLASFPMLREPSKESALSAEDVGLGIGGTDGRPVTADPTNKRAAAVNWSKTIGTKAPQPEEDDDHSDGIIAFLDQDPIERAIRIKARQSRQIMTLAEFLRDVPPPA